MKVVDILAMRSALWAIQVLYIVPLLLTFFSPRKRDLIYFSIIAIALIRIDLFLIPPGIPIPYGMFNRTVGTRVLWGVALGLIFCKRVQNGLVSAEAARAQALAGRDAAVEARALSEQRQRKRCRRGAARRRRSWSAGLSWKASSNLPWIPSSWSTNSGTS